MSILDKYKKNSVIKYTVPMSKSEHMVSEYSPSKFHILNIALTGTLHGGLIPGVTMFAGKSKHFKSLFALLMVKAYMDKYEDAVLLFYDSEFGIPVNYFTSIGIDTERVLHIPITDVEKLKTDVLTQLESLDKKDHVIMLIDSLGNVASKKELDDAKSQSSAADMTRAKHIKGFFRMNTTLLKLTKTPMIIVNHTYDTIEMYSKAVVGGGTGSIYAADNIFIIGKRQVKEGTETVGHEFVLNVEKSRFVKEKAKFIVKVMNSEPISRYTGLMEIALETGHVTKPSAGWYQRVNLTTGEIDDKKYRLADTDVESFWGPILADPSFNAAIESEFKLSNEHLVQQEDDAIRVTSQAIEDDEDEDYEVETNEDEEEQDG